jgi:hypothetical protein
MGLHIRRQNLAIRFVVNGFRKELFNAFNHAEAARFPGRKFKTFRWGVLTTLYEQ